MDLSSYSELFLAESREHLASINHHLLRLENEGDLGVVEEVFRSAHTLKGMAAAMGCPVAAELAHAMENVLSPLREAERTADVEVTGILFEAADAVERAVAVEIRGEGAELDYSALLARLRACGERAGGAGEEAAGSGLRVTVVLRAGTQLPAVRAMLILRRAAELGGVTGVEPSEDRLLEGRFDGSLAFRLMGAADPEAVRAALLDAGDVAHVAVEADETAAEVAAAEAAAEARSEAVAVSPLVRISQRRLDALVNQVGELVVARDRLRQLSAAHADEALDETTESLARLVGELRDEVMRLRMVPVREAFERFPRLVRDTARSLGKRVELTVRGQEVEVDRSLLNELGDLLVHLLRNALDHGIETPEARRALGKPEIGRVGLSALSERERVVVEVSDDGRGIDLDQVRELAVRRGWISSAEAAELSREALLELITRPGFSTADEVTEVSGRGVGLDAVQSRVTELGGKLDIETEPGRGTTFVMRLPLSLAIVRSLLVEVGDETYALPLSAVVEVTEVEEDSDAVPAASLELHGATLPVLCLRTLLEPVAPAAWRRFTPVVVLDAGSTRLAVRVDALHGQHEGVLKPYDAAARMTHVFGGATLLPDGRPVLLLDPARLAARVGHNLVLDDA